MSEVTPTTDEIRAAIVPVDRPLFDRWLTEHDREERARALEEFAAWVEVNGGEDAWAYSHYAEQFAAALRNSNNEGKEPQVGDVTPLRTEKCHARYEEPFVLTGPGNGSNRVHFCTKAEGHGNEHYDDVSRTGWRG